jgi:hypothetical protein
MPAKWAIFFYIVPSSPDNSTNLDARAKRARNEITRLAKKYSADMRISYRLGHSGATPADRVVFPRNGDPVSEPEQDVYAPGDPRPFRQFLKWAHQKGCRGQRCAVFFWGHGFGPAGLFSLEDLGQLGLAASTAAPVPVNVLNNLPRAVSKLSRVVNNLPRVVLPAPGPPAAPSANREIDVAVPLEARVHVERTSRGTRLRINDRDKRTINVPHDLVMQSGDGQYYLRVQLPEVLAGPRPPFIAPTSENQFFLLSTVNLHAGMAALKKLRKRRIDIMLFQDCWVSGLEYAVGLQPDGRVMVASQTLLPIQRDPWPYDRLFRILRDSSLGKQKSYSRLARRVVRVLRNWHVNQQQLRPITALNVSDKTVARAFARLVKLLHRTVKPKQKLSLEHLYSNAPTKNRKKGLYKVGNTGLVDVLRLCAHLEASVADAKLQRACRKLAKAVTTKLILAHDTPDRNRYKGVTVYYQPSQKTVDRLNESNDAHIEWLQQFQYRHFAFDKATRWGHFGFEMQE